MTSAARILYALSSDKSEESVVTPIYQLLFQRAFPFLLDRSSGRVILEALQYDVDLAVDIKRKS